MFTEKLRPFCLLLVTILAVSLVSWGQTCSGATVTGVYGLSSVGTDGSGNPITGEGLLSADGGGRLAGLETLSDNGAITPNVALRGTYGVRADCTGSMVLMPKGGTASHFDLVVVASGNTLRLVGTDAGEVVSAYAQAQGAANCNKTGLSGPYNFQGAGTFVGLGPVAFSGRLTLDGAGKLTGHESGSLAGATFSRAPVFGIYHVAPNCTGDATLNVKGQPPSHISFVVTNGGQGLVLIQTDPGSVVPGSAQQ
jgi:hypothetical protein